MEKSLRIKTGIKGLDEIMHGGIPASSNVLVSGTAGAGKTIMASQFVYYGVKQYKEPSIYLSFEEPIESIRKNNLNFGWDFKTLEQSGKLSFVKYDPYHIDEIPTSLESRIREINAKRVVIDTISALSFYDREEADYRRLVLNISSVLKKLGCTTMLLSEVVPGSLGLSRNGIVEFISDSVIVLYYKRVNSSFARAVQIWKMRGTDHSEKLHPYKITNHGIEVYPKEEAFIDVK
jgi:KaiC/GvpD/RAD55 family RecA-like ATPase